MLEALQAGISEDTQLIRLLDRFPDGTALQVEAKELLRQRILDLEVALRDARASEARLRNLFAAMSDVVLVISSGGRFVAAAPTDPSLFYRPPSEFIGRTMTEILPPEVAQPFMGRIEEVLSQGRRITVEYSLPINGVTRWFSALVSPYATDAVIFVAREISDQKNLQAEFQKRSHDLSERIKELDCLFQVSCISERTDLPLAQKVEAIVRLLPLACQYPQNTCARITLMGRDFTTSNYRQTVHREMAAISTAGHAVGVVEVCSFTQEAFLDEERTLLSMIADRLGTLTGLATAMGTGDEL